MTTPSVLLIGASGFISGQAARLALDMGWETWGISRGQRPGLPGVRMLTADRRDRAAFRTAVQQANRRWDLVIDFVGYEPGDAEQDVAEFRERAGHFVFISTDFVVPLEARTYPQVARDDFSGCCPYGAQKRACEQVFEKSDTGAMRWTILRPCHVYGPGSQLGCLPAHLRDSELLARLRRGEPLKLAGGGTFLQQPIHALDLAQMAFSCLGNAASHGQVYFAAGPDAVESRVYYEILAQELGVRLQVEEPSVGDLLKDHPDWAPFFCHRLYDLSDIRRDKLSVPSTPLDRGLRQQVRFLENLS